MADRSVKIVVDADASPLTGAVADGSKSVDGLGNSTTVLGQKIKSGLALVGLTGGVLSLGAAIK